VTELREPAVAPNPPSAPSERTRTASELEPDAFHANEPPTIVEEPKPLPVALHAATRPLLGPATWIGGTTLWSYVVAGQFVLRAGTPEVLGVGFVVGVLVSTAYVACRRSLELLPAIGEDARKARFLRPTWRGVGVAAAVVLVASLAWSRAGDGPTMLFLLATSCACVVLGKHYTGKPRTRLRTRWRVLGIVAWVAAVALSLMVVVSAVN
jgi:hypothetical protein